MAAESTSCVVVGGGPAGAVLALRLAEAGVPVTVLERAQSFDRRFRGNTLNPAALEHLAGWGLVERVLALPHAKTTHFTAIDAAGPLRFADFAELGGPFPYVLLVQQADVLPVLFEAALAFPHVRLVTGAQVEGLIEEDGEIRGVVYERAGERVELRAPLVVGCDGRGSVVREAAGLAPVRYGVPLDVLWFTLPRCEADDPSAGAFFRFGPGGLLALMNAGDRWQVGALIAKGSFERLRARGLDAFRADVVAAAPDLADRVAALAGWDEVALLRVELSRLRRWHRPGLLLLGDAAHAMSPVGMVGINLAIEDAACAAEVLAEGLRAGRAEARALAEVQRRREGPVRLVQRAQALVHRFAIGPALRGGGRIPPPLRWAFAQRPARRAVSRLIAYGALRRG